MQGTSTWSAIICHGVLAMVAIQTGVIDSKDEGVDQRFLVR